jgi:hypothetical protein
MNVSVPTLLVAESTKVVDYAFSVSRRTPVLLGQGVHQG